MSKSTWFCVEIGQCNTTVFTTSKIHDVKILDSRCNNRKEPSIMCFTKDGRKFQAFAYSSTEPYFDTTIRNISSAIGTNQILLKYKEFVFYPADILSYYLNFITYIPEVDGRYENVLYVEPNSWRNEKIREDCVKEAAKLAGIKNIEFISKGKAVAFCMYNRVYPALKDYETKYACIIDAGESAIEAGVYKFTNKEIEQVLCRTIDFGGENVTYATANHLINRFIKESKDINVRNFMNNIKYGRSPQKAKIFLNSAKKAKEDASDSPTIIAFSGIALSTDLDFSMQITAKDINENEEIKFYIPQLKQFFDDFYDEIRRKGIKLELCELRGGNGSTRFLKEIVRKSLHQELTARLNCTEIFAEGAAFYKKAQLTNSFIPNYKESNEIINETIILPKYPDNIKYKLVFHKNEKPKTASKIIINENYYQKLQQHDDEIERKAILLNDAHTFVNNIDKITRNINKALYNIIDLNKEKEIKQKLSKVLGDSDDCVDIRKLDIVFRECVNTYVKFLRDKIHEDMGKLSNESILLKVLSFQTQAFKVIPNKTLQEVKTFGVEYTNDLNIAKKKKYRINQQIIVKKQYF